MYTLPQTYPMACLRMYTPITHDNARIFSTLITLQGARLEPSFEKLGMTDSHDVYDALCQGHDHFWFCGETTPTEMDRNAVIYMTLNFLNCPFSWRSTTQGRWHIDITLGQDQTVRAPLLDHNTPDLANITGDHPALHTEGPAILEMAMRNTQSFMVADTAHQRLDQHNRWSQGGQ